ncbi:hypothetical protein C8J57DRAFT_1536196 [Mycena rebaudengoi]|nr:hypothetical protein C8J57DRAFT_1536196 [Mycena rebaudengoi]
MSLNKLQERRARAAATQANIGQNRLNTLQKLRRLEKQWVTVRRPALNTERRDYEAELEADVEDRWLAQMPIHMRQRNVGEEND